MGATITDLTSLGLITTLRELLAQQGEFHDLFRQDAPAYGALRAIQGNIGAVGLTAWTGPPDDDARDRATGLSASRVATLLANPDGADIDGADMIDLAVEWFLDDGEAHLVMRDARWLPVTDDRSAPTFLTVHGAQEMTPDVQGRRAVGWSMLDDRYTQRTFDRVPDPSHLVVKKPDKDRPYRGYGVRGVVGSGGAGEIAWLVKSYLRALYKNGAIPDVIIEFEGTPGPAAVDDFLTQWNQRHQGANRAGRVGALTDGATAKTLGKTHVEQQLVEILRGWCREDVLLALNVPESELGKADAHTYSNGISANGQFWNQVLFPIMRQFEYALNHPRKGLGPRFGVWIGWDYAAIRHVIENVAGKAETYAKLVGSGVPINVAKRVVGLRGVPDVAGGDVPLVMSTLIPVEATATSPSAVGAGAGGADTASPAPAATDDEPPPAEKSLRPGRVARAHARVRAAQAVAVTSLRRSAERAYLREFRRLLQAMRKDALAAVDAAAAAPDGLARSGPLGPTVLVNAEKWATEWEATIRTLLESVLPDAADLVADETGESLHVWSATHPSVTEYVNAKVSQIRNVPAEVRDAVHAAVAEGVSASEHPDQIARRVKDAFNAESKRVEAIARTESGEAVNTGRYTTMELEGVTEHEWSAFASADSRHAGTPIDGQRVRIGERFVNGLLFPLDPAGPADEVVNCRCVALAV